MQPRGISEADNRRQFEDTAILNGLEGVFLVAWHEDGEVRGLHPAGLFGAPVDVQRIDGLLAGIPHVGDDPGFGRWIPVFDGAWIVAALRPDEDATGLGPAPFVGLLVELLLLQG